MKRIRKILIALICAVPAVANAFGLGQLKLESGLNQPFEARIEMLSVKAEELSSLSIHLADADAFQRAGIDRLFILSSLKFEVHETESGPDFIRVYTVDPIREPYLNFLVEASWSNGRLLREYTVLLDPPLYDPKVRRAVVSAPAISAPKPAAGTGTVGAEPAEQSSGGAAAVEGGYTKGEFGPTSANDTLWSIATTTRADSSISVQQMMIALLRANPDAFTGNNINGLKKGQILHIPTRDEVLALSQADAIAEAKAQNAMWQESHGGLPETTPTRPIDGGRTTAADESTVTPVAKENSELRLVAATEAGAKATRGAGTGTAASGAATKDLALANEQIESLTSENAELKSRLTESESIIEDQKRLLALKDNELAMLKQQAAKSGETPITAEQPAPAAATETPTTGAGTATTTQPEVPAVATSAAPAPAETRPAATEASQPAPVAEQPAPAEASPGLVDQILGIVMDNIVYVAVGGGVMVLVILGFFVASRRRAKAMEPEAGAYAGLNEEPTLAPGGLIESEAATMHPETEAPEDEEEEGPAAGDKTAFIAPGQAVPAPQAAAAEAEEDPLAEVNVFLAYEHFDQAEEFVRDAIASNPDKLDFHSKLLEVFYAAGDKVKYEAAAKVLHDKVDGAGPHWDMAVVMWSEMSPNRALFEAGGAEEETPAAKAAGGGVLDLTAGEAKPGKPAAATDMGLDFDLGDTTDVPAAAAKKTTEGDDVLDLTAAASTLSMAGEDLLDVTAAVGLEPESEPEQAAPAEDEMMLDITSGKEAKAENLLDISFQGSDNLLDVTAQADTGTLSGEEDLLDVTSATSAGADADELLEIEKAAPTTEAKDDHVLDFDIGGVETPSTEVPGGAAEEESLELDISGTGLAAPGDDNVIEFDSGQASKAEDKELEIGLPETSTEGADAGLEFSLDLGSDAAGSIDAGAETMEVKVDDYPAGLEANTDKPAADSGLEIDLSIGDTDEPVLELDTGGEEGGIEFDLTGGDEENTGELDLEATLKIPDIGMESEDEDEDEDHTVFVPRSSDAKEQSAEDEVATKLDLAKAYVELGDKDSARGLLEEIIQEGSAQQKATAKELLKQVK